MVFESLVASVLSGVLGDYVQDLQTSQLSVGIFSGQVELSNLSLKTSALDKFKLPINVKEGFMGQLTMQIPWSDLKNKPIKINIENLYLLAVPKSEQDYDFQQELDAELKAKFDRLEAAEIVNKAAGSSADSSFMTLLATKVIDNLQISVTNIHIRYEDTVSTPLVSPFLISESILCWNNSGGILGKINKQRLERVTQRKY